MKRMIGVLFVALLLIMTGCGKQVTSYEEIEKEVSSEAVMETFEDEDVGGAGGTELKEIVEETTTEETTATDVEIARNNVVEKWRNEEGVLGTTRYIEDIYKQYQEDPVISNIYYYSVAKEQYGHYEALGKSDYLEQAIEFAEKIDPDYSGEFASEIHSFVAEVIPSGVTKETHAVAQQKEDKYGSLTNSQKKEICRYIEGRYEYYDNLNGGYSGDKYSDTIMLEAAQKYGLTVSQVEIIWMNMYSY